MIRTSPDQSWSGTFASSSITKGLPSAPVIFRCFRVGEAGAKTHRLGSHFERLRRPELRRCRPFSTTCWNCASHPDAGRAHLDVKPVRNCGKILNCPFENRPAPNGPRSRTHLRSEKCRLATGALGPASQAAAYAGLHRAPVHRIQRNPWRPAVCR
jgi:hypothetical protein